MKVYAYIHPQLNILCCALFKEVVPQGVNVVELDVETPDDVILDNGTIRVKTDAEKLSVFKQTKISQLKSYVATLLAPTDYIITKIAEAQLLNNTDLVNALKQNYSSQLQQRENIRAWSDQIKQAINNATTLDALNSIDISYGGGK